jgi:protein-S-isoprenylcysteine O-methyltransferase Ste14
MFFNLVASYLLFTSAKSLNEPSGPLESILPVISTFFNLSINFLSLLPPFMWRVLMPNNLLPLTQTVGAMMLLGGIAFSIWGLISLNTSFAIMVQAKSMRQNGAYQVVRHPMYTGYFIQFFGLSLIHLTLAETLFYIISSTLLVTRALLEERKLAENFPSYKEYLGAVPRFFPNFLLKL